jgi:putative spermidine/putrescine transport system ATP-binding protein
VERVVKRYGTYEALKGVSVVIGAGEFVTLLGPSGSGKTTLLNMIAGFVQIDEGNISVDGRVIGGVPPWRRDIGMVFQHYALFPHMTVEKNVAFPLKRRGVEKREIQQRVDEALGLVHLSEYKARYPRQLSGGQQQRVALARAIVFRPRVLLMDEPLGALDKKLREELQLEIKRIHRELGTTVVYVTHDQEEALAMSDRIAILNHGSIEQLGAGEELYSRPANVFVANFMGESNVFEGEVRLDGGFTSVVNKGGVVRAASEPWAKEGTRAAVVVRPERVRIASSAEQKPLGKENVFEGVVRDVTYLGSVRKFAVELRSGVAVIVRETVTEEAKGDIDRGDRVWVAWNPKDGVLVEKDESRLEHATKHEAKDRVLDGAS